jgi:hypothetical protein
MMRVADTPRDIRSGLGDAERRRPVATFDNYADAERAVDHLSDNKFPVERASIVGRDLHYVEQVTGRMGWLEAMGRGALSGALAGALIGWLFFVFDWFNPVVARGWLILDGLWFGLIIGALTGLLAHALLRGRRDFSSVAGMRADRYEVLVDDDVAEEAIRLLGQQEGRPADEARFSRAETPEREAVRPDTRR